MSAGAISEGAVLLPLRWLDVVRGWALAATGRTFRGLLRDRGLRVAVVASLGVCFAFAATTVAPRLLLLYGPLVLGVPHILADVRYLVVQPGALRDRGFRWLVLPLLAALWVSPSLLTGVLAIAMTALVAPAARQGGWPRRLAVLAACVVLAVAVKLHGGASRVVFAHAHNLIAVLFVMLFAIRRGHLRRGAVPLGLFMVCGAGLLSGALDPLLEGAVGRALGDRAFGALAVDLAPGASPAVALRVTLFYAFAQSVHYASWLRVVPEQARRRSGIRGFVSSYRALVADVGVGALAVTALAMAGLGLWAVADSWASRAGYLRLAFFHGPLELAMLAWLFVRGSWEPYRGAPP